MGLEGRGGQLQARPSARRGQPRRCAHFSAETLGLERMLNNCGAHGAELASARPAAGRRMNDNALRHPPAAWLIPERKHPISSPRQIAWPDLEPLPIAAVPSAIPDKLIGACMEALALCQPSRHPA